MMSAHAQEMLVLPDGVLSPVYALRWNAAIKAHLKDPDVLQRLEALFQKGVLVEGCAEPAQWIRDASYCQS
jgi:hypothetical protein